MNSQQIHGPNRGKGQYMMDCQTKHLCSMSSLWKTTRMSRWMTPTLTTVLIRPFLNLFLQTLLLMFSGLRRPHTQCSILNKCDCEFLAFRLWSLEASFTLIARSGLDIFSVIRILPSKWKNWFLAKVPDSMPFLHRKAYFTCHFFSFVPNKS